MRAATPTREESVFDSRGFEEWASTVVVLSWASTVVVLYVDMYISNAASTVVFLFYICSHVRGI